MTSVSPIERTYVPMPVASPDGRLEGVRVAPGLRGSDTEACLARYLQTAVTLEPWEFREALVEKRLVGRDFAAAYFDLFEAYDPLEGNNDALQHILVGNRFGGGHHPATALSLDYPIVVASAFAPPEAAKQNRKEARPQRNFTSPTGAVNMIHGHIVYSKDGCNQFANRLGGLSAFPFEWSSEDVIAAIVKVRDNPARTFTTRRGSIGSEGLEKGVALRTLSSAVTGKILAAHPVLTRKDYEASDRAA